MNRGSGKAGSNEIGMNDLALEAIRTAIRGTAFETCVYLVGGAVRDRLLGLDHSGDFDLVTTGSSVRLSQLLAPISSIQPVTYPRFGTAMVKIGGHDVELVTARSESYDQTSRKPIVQAATLLEDAMRRDFTVNSLMRNLYSEEILDLTGNGLSDLRSRVLRTPRDRDVPFTNRSNVVEIGSVS
jgi:poly(A) polymerase